MRMSFIKNSMFIMLFLGSVIKSYSQKTYTFKEDGQIELTGPIFSHKLFKPEVALFNLPQDQKLSADQRKEVRNELAKRFREAKENMEDPELGLKQFYSAIWDEATYNSILEEMGKLLTYLTGTDEDTMQQQSFSYVPSPREIKTLLDENIYLELKRDTVKGFHISRVIFVNNLKRYLLQRLFQTMQADHLQDYAMSGEYKRAWRELEKALQETKDTLQRINRELAPCNVIDSIKAYDKFKKSITDLLGKDSKNAVVQLLRKDFFKKWLWYSQGYLLINPLMATTPDRRYPVTERMGLLTDSIRKKELLSDSAENTLLANLLQTKSIRNELVVPDFKKQGINNYFFYNAANDFEYLNKRAFPKQLDTRAKPGFFIYNVPAKEKLTVSVSSETIKDQSALVQAVDEALGAGALSDVLTNASTITGNWGKISTDVNGFKKVTNPSGQITGSVTTLVDKVSLLTRTSSGWDGFSPLMQQVYWENAIDGYEDEKLWKGGGRDLEDKEYFVTINKRKIPVTKNMLVDKVSFAEASILVIDAANCSSCQYPMDKCLIDSFVIRDRCYPMEYKDTVQLKKDVEAFLVRFKCYFDLQRSYRESLNRLSAHFNDSLLPLLTSYARIFQRSLPMVLTRDSTGAFKEETSGKVPELRTVVYAPELPKPPSEITFKVMSDQVSKIKVIEDTATSKVAIRHKFKYAKRHWLDFSIGLGVTTNDYFTKQASGNLVDISEADRVKPIAGLHIYPLGLLKVDDRIKPNFSRISLYAGLSLKKALDNFYTGVSYDIVPGLRCIGGVHFYKDTRFTISNGQIIDQASAYKKSGAFLSLNLEPLTFVKLIGLIK
ncbi:MAG: hypothetical protein SFU20_06540 [Chitinophagaceae bacterium]|nr:hypothetical protein [Chitinophagaceae bacterium]